MCDVMTCPSLWYLLLPIKSPHIKYQFKLRIWWEKKKAFRLTPLISILTHWGWVTHICVRKLTIIGSDNNLSPGWHQAIIWTNCGIFVIWPSGKKFRVNHNRNSYFSFKKVHLKMSSGKWRPFCVGLNVLRSKQSGVTSKALSTKPSFAWHAVFHAKRMVNGVTRPVTQNVWCGNNETYDLKKINLVSLVHTRGKLCTLECHGLSCVSCIKFCVINKASIKIFATVYR